MAATVVQNISYVKNNSNSEAPPSVVTLPIAASQGAYDPGAPMYLNSSGQLKLATTADGSDDKFQYIALVGQATELAAGTSIKVYEITDDQIWRIFVENNDADATASAAYKGNEYGLRVATGAGKIGYTTVDVSNANAVVRVVNTYHEFNPDHQIYGSSTKSPNMLLVRFLPGVLHGELA